MRNSLKGFLAATVIGAPVMAQANTVTYDFAGTVTSATGVYSSAGSTVSGAITINFGAANPSQSSGTVGSTSAAWTAQADGGTYYGGATPTALVFSWSLKSGAISVASSSPSSAGSASAVLGYPPTGGSLWEAEDAEWSSGSSYIANVIALFGTSAIAPYNSNGLPILVGSTPSESNSLTDNINGTGVGNLDYTITSLTPVPLPASAWLMLSGAVGFGAMVRRRCAT
jgi:hypothetical protein